MNSIEFFYRFYFMTGKKDLKTKLQIRVYRRIRVIRVPFVLMNINEI